MDHTAPLVLALAGLPGAHPPGRPGPQEGKGPTMRLLTMHDRRLSPMLTDRREQIPAVAPSTSVVEGETSLPVRRGGWEAQVSRLRGRVEDARVLMQEDLNDALREPLMTLGRQQESLSEEQQAQLQQARCAFVQALQAIERELRHILLPFEGKTKEVEDNSNSQPVD